VRYFHVWYHGNANNVNCKTLLYEKNTASYVNFSIWLISISSYWLWENKVKGAIWWAIKNMETLLSCKLSFTWNDGNIKLVILYDPENFYKSIFNIWPGYSFSYTYWSNEENLQHSQKQCQECTYRILNNNWVTSCIEIVINFKESFLNFISVSDSFYFLHS